MDILLGVIDQGLIYAFLCLGIYITFQILNFPDLTVDGSFPLGAAITVALLSLDINPLIALAFSFIGGLIAGSITGILNVKFSISDLLSGVIVQTGLYTINLLIAGASYVAIFDKSSIFTGGISLVLSSILRQNYINIIIGLIIVILVKVGLDLFLKTKAGYLLKATGDNPVLVKTLAKDPESEKIKGLALANGLVALSGSMVAQQQGFFDISMGTGAMIMGLASLIIGIKLFSKIKFMQVTSMVILGSIIYKGVIALAIQVGLSPNYMKLVTALIFLLILVFSKEKRRKVFKHVKA